MTIPKWNFYKDGVSASFINLFLSCREQCRISYYLGYAPAKEPIYFNFGSAVHHVLEKAYDPAFWKSPTFDQICEWLGEYYSEKNTNNTDVKKFEENIQVQHLVSRMMLEYFKFRKGEDFKYNFLRMEQSFKIPFQNTFLKGRLDCTLENSDGQIVLMDHKTASQIDEEGIQSALPFDIQINFYSFVLSLLGKAPSLVFYNIIRRPGEIKKESETYEEYVDRIIQNVRLKPKHYFKRIRLPIEKQDIHTWSNTQLVPILEDVQRWFDSGCKSYMNPNHLISKYGRSQFFNAITAGDFSGLTLKKDS